MDSLLHRITTFCIHNNIIESADESWFRYGIEKRIVTFIGLIPFVALAILLSDIGFSLSLFMSFFSLRRKVGGYHSKSILGCMIVSLFTEVFFITILYPLLNDFLRFSIILGAIILVYCLAPYAHPNMNLDFQEVCVLRIESRREIIRLALLNGICLLMRFYQIADGLTVGMAMAVFMLCIANITERRKYNERKNGKAFTSDEESCC